MSTAPFLGISRSASGKMWMLRTPVEANGLDRQALAIAQRLELPEIVGRLLASRGQTIDTAEGFLNPRLRDLMPDPSSLRDMDRAVARIIAAIEQGQQIAIFGDYDVDGATSAALLMRFLRAVGAKPIRLYVPDRMAEGYGPNGPAMHKLKSEGVDLVVTVDCGITAFAPLQAAADLGLDVVVVDHHMAEPGLPPAVAVINPNRLDEAPGLGQLAAVGVAYLLVVALNRGLRQSGWYRGDRPEPDLMQWLDLVALGTVCDVVPLTGLNRALVTQGLKVMGQRRNIGINALSDVAKVMERPGTYHAGFLFGPRVNAGGRVGAAELGAQLLSGDDPATAAALAQRLDTLNTERRVIEAEVLAAAIAAAESQAADNPHLILVADHGWHPGVIGIVAGRLKDRYQRPVCVVALDEVGMGKGSGRSVAGLHLGNAIIAAREAGIIARGGGHAMAAGFEAPAAKLPELSAFIASRFTDELDGSPLMPVLHVDGALQPRAATPDFVTMLEQIGPFGSGNPEPRFVLPDARIAFADLVGTGHVRCQIQGADGTRLKAIAFRVAEEPLGQLLLRSRGTSLHLAGNLRVDRWQGREEVQLQIDDAAATG
jgi:single-stranded-DNA-specific exonuclease